MRHSEMCQACRTALRRSEQKERRKDRHLHSVCDCGSPMGRRAKTCPSCRREAISEAHEELVSEIEWLLSFGESVPSMLRSLGRTAVSTERALYRFGRPDLARKFNHKKLGKESQCA